jgi:hypothetical protein
LGFQLAWRNRERRKTRRSTERGRWVPGGIIR